jgi:hypothetical protein
MGVSLAHNFAITSLHRANDLHFPQWTTAGPVISGDRWIALYDIHLILCQLQPSERVALADEAIRCRTAGVCARAVAAACELYGTEQLPCVSLLQEQLLANARHDEAIAYHCLSAPRQRLRDLRALQSLRDRAAWIREHLFPPSAYMHAQYPSHNQPLALLRLRRAVRAWRRWSSNKTDTLSS